MFVVIIYCLILLPGISHASAVVEVRTGIAPYAFLAEQIGGDYVHVQTLMDQGQDPHTFEPTPRKILSLASARLFLLSGLDFEDKLTDKIQKSFASLEFVDLRESGSNESGQGKTSSDQHGDSDQHAWLSPILFAKQAGVVAEAFARVDPQHKEVYFQNLHNFQEELDLLTIRIAKKLQPFRGRSFFVFHPAFGHFAEAFGLRQVAVEEGGRLPTPKKIARLITQAKEEKVRIIFVQPQFDQASAKIIASSIGGVVVAIDPLAKDVLGNFSILADQLERAF